MRTEEEIRDKIKELESDVTILLNKQRDSNFTTAVASIQEIINSTNHRIVELKWVLNKEL